MASITIADPGLVASGGHNQQLNTQIVDGLAALGERSVRILAGHEYQSRSLGTLAPAPVEPRLSGSFYAHDDADSAKAKSEELAAALIEAIHAADPGGALFCHTADALFVDALARALSRTNRPDVVALVATPYCDRTLPRAKHFPRFEATLKMLTNRFSRQFRFFAETAPLAERWCQVLSRPCAPFELPAPADVVARRASAPRTGGAVTFSYLGAGRREKGFLKLLPLIDAVNAEADLAETCRFFIQGSPQIVGYDPDVKRDVDALKGRAYANVELAETALDRSTYLDHLIASDVVLALYERNAYQVRGTGIAVEAAAAGAAVMAYANTSPDYLASRHSAPVRLVEAGLELEAVRFTLRHIDAIRRLCWRRSTEFIAEHTAEAYARILLEEKAAAGLSGVADAPRLSHPKAFV